MKKVFSVMMAALLAVFVFIPFVGVSASGDDVPPEEVQQFGAVKNLINSCSLNLSKYSATQLALTAHTTAVNEVTKCGLSYIIVQRFINNSWYDYVRYTDLYDNDNSFSLGIVINAERGHTYRAICEHYAEKKFLLIFTDYQKVYSETYPWLVL
jgi:hypothetical protein